MEPVPRVVWMPGEVCTEVHLTGEDTDDLFCLLVDHPPAGWSLPAHLHRGAAETIYVLEGEFEMTVDGHRSLLATGETLHVPAGTVHSGKNVGSTLGRRIVIISPAGMENFFLEVGAPSADDEIEQAAALDSATRHGWRFVGESGRD